MTTTMKCPNCSAEMIEINFDKAYLGRGVKVVGCTTCNALFQDLPSGGGLVPIDNILDVVKASGVRAMAAISTPTSITLKSLIEDYHVLSNRVALELATQGTVLREHLAQIEGLLDSAISALVEMSMVPGPAREVMAQIQQARELVSTKPPKNRGVGG